MIKRFSTLGAIILLAAACTEGDRANDIEVKDDVITTENPEDGGHDLNSNLSDGEMKGPIELIAVESIPPVVGASLAVTHPAQGARLAEGVVEIEYDVKEFSLGTATGIKTNYDLAESDKGQHIHAILNNEPYMAHYEPKFSKDLPQGRYLLLSFLSRSYHLSLKDHRQYELISFTVGEPEIEAYDTGLPYLFYSRPKGEYNVTENADILLDFYLVNCELSEDGYKVKAKIAGYDFTIDSWQPYIVRGMPEGMNTITLELVDGNGNTVDSPFNPVTRNFQIDK